MTGMIQEITGRAGGRLRAALFFFCALLPLYGQEDYMLSGPLYGKNYYLPHLPVYSFPGFSPRSGQRGDRYLTAGYTGINEFVAYDEETTALDYESSVMEAGVSWRPQDRLLVGADLRLISYYGGFMDPLIESFHSIFDFPNGARELFGQNRLFVFMDNRSGSDLVLEEPALSLGDTDLYGVWTLRDDSELALAIAGAVKLPTGSLDALSGSGWADLGFQFLGEWGFRERWAFHFQQGFVLPGDWIGRQCFSADSYAVRPSSQTTLALQYSPRCDWRILAQTRINTSPVNSDRKRVYALLGTVNLFSLPQTAFLMGVKKSFGDWAFQAHFEEDPLTFEGADILAGIKLIRSF